MEKAGWADILGNLLRSFVPLRDVFGYMVPGAAFLWVAKHSHVLGEILKELCKACEKDLPWWAVVLVLLATSYVTGHILVAASYAPFDARKLLPGEKKAEKEAGEELYYAAKYPDIFLELSRQSILLLMRRGLAAAAVLLYLLSFWLLPGFQWPLLGVSIVMVMSTSTGERHIKELKADTLKAAKLADKEDKESAKAK